MYDYSLTLNVHSQLNDTADWIRTQLLSELGYKINPNDLLARKIIDETEGIIRKFNDAIFAATKEKAFIGYEIGIQGRNSTGIQGAMQTYADLRRREQGNKISSIRQTMMTWPYDTAKQISFDIVIETLSLTKTSKDVH